MTLTQLIPSLRRTLPDPLSLDRWPEFTVVSTTDVTVAGVSLLCLVDWCGTPCVHTAAAVVACSGGRPSETEDASVVVARVTDVTQGPDGLVLAAVDANLCRCSAILDETRLIGRASTAHTTRVRMTSTSDSHGLMVQLPRDLGVGDLIAVPCVGTTSLHQIRPARASRC